MTNLRSALHRYLSLRQGLGYKYQQQARRLADFVSFMEGAQCRGHHHDVGRGVGDAAARATRVLGFAVDRRARFRTSRREHRSDYRSAARWDLAGLEACQATYLQRRGNQRAVGGSAGPAANRRLAAMDLPLPVWAVRGDGHAFIRGDRPSARRRRSRGRRLDGSANQIRQVAPHSLAFDDVRGPARLCRPA